MTLDIGSAVGRIIIEAEQALKATEGVGRSLSGLGGAMATAGGVVAAGAAAAGGAILALGASSVGVAREFESSMAIMSTAVDPVSLGVESTAEAMAILGDASLAVGSDTSLIGVSASTAAEAMTGLYKAGLSTGEIFGDLQGYMAGTAELSGALRASIDLAAASELDMVAASDLAAITLATFGGELETEAERAEFINSALNNFVQTADASVANVGDLAAALTNVGPTAAAFGFGLEDVNAALGILSTRGISGSEAGTALKSMMTNIMRQTPEVTGALQELGISLYDVEGNMRPLPDIIAQFDSALNGTREVMVTVGGRTEEQNRQLELAMNAYDQATEAIYKHETGLKVLSEDGLAKVQAQQAAANSEIERLQSIVGDTKVALQDMTQEQRNQYIQTIAGTYGMNAMNSLLEAGVIGWEEMTTAVGEAATMQETAAARTKTFDGAMEALGGVLESLRIGIGLPLIQEVLTPLATLFADLASKHGPALTTMFENIGAGFSRIIEVVKGGQLGELFTVFEDGSSVLGGIFEAFGMGEEAANRLATGISGIVTTVQTALGPIVNAVTQFVSWKDVLIGLGAAVLTFLIPALAAIIAPLLPVIAVFAGITAAVALLRNAWENNWGGIQEKVIQVGAALVPVFDAITSKVAAVVAFISPIFETLKIVIGGFIAGLQNGMAPLDAVRKLIMGLALAFDVPMLRVVELGVKFNEFVAVAQTVWGLIQSVIGSAVEVIRPAIERIIETAQGAGTKLGQLAGPLQDLWAKIGPFIQAAATIIGAILVGLVGVIVGIVNGIANALDPLIDTFVNLAENIIRIVGGIIEFLTGFFNLVIGLFTGNGEKIKEAWNSMGEGIKDIVGGLVTGVWELFSGLVETVATLIDGFITGIIEFFQNLYDEIVGNSIIPDLVEAIVDWFEDLITWIGDALKKLWAAVSEPFIQMWQDLTAWFGERVADAIQLGSNIVQGIVDGINAVGQSILNVLGDWVQAAINWAKELLGIKSPSTVFYDIGVNIGQGLIAGLQSQFSDAAELMDELFAMMGNVSGLAGGFGSQFEQQILGPLQEGVAAMGDQLASWDDAMGSIAEQLGFDARFPFNPGAESELLRIINYAYSSPQQRDQARVLIAMMQERNQLQMDYLALQEQLTAEERRLAALREKEQQNTFLQEQLKLLQLIRENNLSADILNGLTLGLGADVGAIMDAMRHALEQMIQAAEQQLGIASPSSVFRGIGRQAMEGLKLGISDSRAVVGVMRDMMDELAGAGRWGLQPAPADVGRTAHLYGGQHFYIERPSRSILDDVQALLAP